MYVNLCFVISFTLSGNGSYFLQQILFRLKVFSIPHKVFDFLLNCIDFWKAQRILIL